MRLLNLAYLPLMISSLKSSPALLTSFHSTSTIQQVSLLQTAEKSIALATLGRTGWNKTPNRDAIIKTFQFGDFVQVIYQFL